MDSMKKEKQLKISSETVYVYAPLAHPWGYTLLSSVLLGSCILFAIQHYCGCRSHSKKETEAAGSI